MNNDFKEVCMETFRNAWNSRSSTDGMQILVNAFFVVAVSGLVTACVMLELPYNLTNEIINKYKIET